MSTTSAGDKLESSVFDLLQSEILAGRFFATADCCRLFRKKGYHSKDRNKEIVFDISIEISLPNAPSYSLLVLIECKNYNHAVPVDDAEEFFAKMQQVSGANLKGVIVSTTSFQEGALTYCKSKGIGLLRYFGSEDFKWVLHRSPSALSLPSSKMDWLPIHRGLTQDVYQSHYFDFYGYCEGLYTTALTTFFGELIRQIIDDQPALNAVRNPLGRLPRFVDYIPEEEIERQSEEVLKTIGYRSGPVPISEICSWQTKETGLIVQTGIAATGSDLAQGILGRIAFDPPQISIYHYPEGKDTREKFTLAHELGHYFLGHSAFMVAEYYQQADFDCKPPNLGIRDIRRMEWQANCFASCLLLPRQVFVPDFLALVEARGLENRGFGFLFVDGQRCNQDNYYMITSALQLRYRVSRSVVKTRLARLGLLNDVRDVRSLLNGRIF